MTHSRQQLVDQARSWIDTRFHHQGRVKKTRNSRGGVDCIGLIIGVAAELDLKSRSYDRQGNRLSFSSFDKTDYAREPNGEILEATLDRFLEQVEIEAMQPGDVVLFSIAKHPQHLGMVGNSDEGFNLIHSYSPVGRVIEHRFCDKWRRKIVKIYRFPTDCFEV